MKKKLLLLVLPFFITIHLSAQYDDLFEVLDSTFDSITSQSQIWGFSAAMLLPDSSLWKRATGVAQELPDEQPLTTEHVMGIGSVTKSFVSATMLLMMEDGLLGLDDSIGMYLDPYPNVSPEVTIRQLLSHRSGIDDFINSVFYNELILYPDSIWVTDSVLHHYVFAPTSTPGAEWKYSSTNYLLASRIIENITGQNWYEVVRERILDPLELNHTFALPHESLGSVPYAHVWDDVLGSYSDLQGNGYSLNGVFSSVGGAGGLVSNPEDLVRFNERLHGENSFLQESTLQEMHTDYEYPGGGIYGLGVKSLGNNSWGHGGTGLYNDRVFYYSDEHMALAVHQNDSRWDGTGSDYIDFIELDHALRDAFFNYVPTSTMDIYQEGGFSVFPNPANDRITLEVSEDLLFNEPVPCFLMDATGRILQPYNIEKKRTELFLGSLPKGFYFLKVGNYTTKIFII